MQALQMSLDAIKALSAEAYTQWQMDAVQGWADAFGQKPTLELQFNLIKEEALELSAAGMALSAMADEYSIADLLKEGADLQFVIAGMAMVNVSSEEVFGKFLQMAPQIKAIAETAIEARSYTIKHFGWGIEAFQNADREAFYRVVKSNMTKLGDDGKPIFSEAGKILKGPNYKAPDLTDLGLTLMAVNATLH